MRRVNILNDNLQKVAVLQNAKNIDPRFVLNGVGSLSFELPYTDDKRRFIKPFAYVELTDALGVREDLFRVLPAARRVGNGEGTLTVECEHVLATLLDDVMPGWHQYGGTGIYTREALDYTLGFQLTRRWVLGDCEYADQYENGWQHEKCLTAFFGVLKAYADYKLEYDVSVFPWHVHVRKLNYAVAPKMRIAWGYNMTGIEKLVDPTNLYTRLYCYGYGEGVNQLSIAEVNGGREYIENPAAIALYGIKCGYYIAREIEDAQTLLASGRAVLEQVSKPKVTYIVSAANLFEATGNELDRPAAGKIVKVYDEQDGELITHVAAVEGDIQQTVTLSNIADDVADAIASIADRQRIEQTYAQGSTQLYAQSTQANATPSKGAILNFNAPEDLRYINAVRVKITLERFRAYSQATGAGGGAVETSEAGGGTQTTTSMDTEKSRTSSSGGGSTQTSSLGGAQTTTAAVGGNGAYTSTTSGHNHFYQQPVSHSHSVANHSHAVSVPSHTHTVSIPAHNHDVAVPFHKHSFNVPEHTHQITPGIFEFGSPKAAVIKVNGKEIAAMGTNAELDITAALLSGGSIPRGAWQHIEVVPDDLAYVTISMIFQGFVQSRGGGKY